MASNLDRPLDDMVDDARKQQRGQRGRGRGARARGSAVGPVRNQRTNLRSAPTAKPDIPLMADGSKIIVSNLPLDVTEAQIRDLFAATIGPVKRIGLSYDSRGKSTGTATIEFARPADAQRAHGQYNGRLIDQKRPMKVEIIFDPTRVPPPPLATRMGPAPRGTAPTRARGGRGRGGRGRGKATRPAVTAADLDAEMEDWQAQGTNEAAA